VTDLPGSAGGALSAGIAPKGLRFGPTVRANVPGAVLPMSPIAALAAGKANKVPFAVGANEEELAAALVTAVKTQKGLDAHVTTVFGLLGKGIAADIKKTYKVADFKDARAAMVALYSDMRFVCPARRIARAAAKGQMPAVFRYHFGRRGKLNKGEKPAGHGVELLYVFGTMSDIALFKPHADDLGLAAQMQTWWRQLAASGKAGKSGSMTWPSYDATKDTTLWLDQPPKVVDGVHTKRCDMWDSVSSKLGLE